MDYSQEDGEMPFFPWSVPCEDALKKFGTDIHAGLTPQQVQKAQQIFGKNELTKKSKQSNFTIFLRQFRNPMVYTLSVAAFIALILGEVIDAVAIIAILLLNAVIGFIQEEKASNALEALKKLTVPQTRVFRGGKIQTVPSYEIVPGDLAFLEAGDYVSADARIIEAHQLSVDESTLTGESTPVRKNIVPIDSEVLLSDRKNMVHAGTAINTGSVKALVTATGMNSEMGKVAGLLDETKSEESTLQKRMGGVTHKLIILALIVVVIVIILRWMEGDPLFMIFMSAISLAVAAIPEGLPTVVTLALTLAVRRMTSRNAIVRNIASVETLGSTDIICSDKTGTLTTGNMTVREDYLLEESKRQNFMEALVLCNNASIEGTGSGDTTEQALLAYADQLNYSIHDIKVHFARLNEWSFDSDRKRMSVAVRVPGGVRIITKGAPESMFNRCNLSEEEKSLLTAKVQELSSQGKRILAVAEKEGELLTDVEEVEIDLTFLGLVAMADPPKPESIAAVRECINAGIKVVMITGDHPVTARAIAGELGIVVPGKFENTLTGREIESLSDEELRKHVESTAVYARVSPSHKLRIVEILQKNGHIVAMTGDGVNDAPALKKAQIGVSMGKGGTEVARQASKIILTDDNFATIVNAVEEGRAIYGNIKRTIQYLLSTNLSEILIVLGASIIGLPLPFTPVGLLWINLVTDGFPSLALAAEPLEKDILKNSSRPSPASFFDKGFIEELFFIGIIMSILCLGIYYYLIPIVPIPKAKSIAFNLLVYMSLFRSFSCRSDTKTFFEMPLNFYHLGAVVLPIILQFWILEFETPQRIFQVSSLSLVETFVLILIALIPTTLVELRKLYVRKRALNVHENLF